jgi:hypothetical protein
MWLTVNCVSIQISIVLISFLVPLNDKSVQKYLGFNESNDKLLSPYSVTIYCHIVLWFVILVIRYYMRSVYYRRLRILGYYKHHSLVKTLSLIPSLVLHKTNALLLLLSTILYMYGQNVVKIGDKIHLKATNFEQIIISISVAIISPFLMKWLYHEIRFRRDRNPPDIFCVEDPQHLVTSAGLNEIGVRYAFIAISATDVSLTVCLCVCLVSGHHLIWRTYWKNRRIWYIISNYKILT